MLKLPIRWRMLLVLFLARTAMAFQFQSVPSAGPLLVGDLGISFAQLGTLIGLYMLPGIALALPGGLLARWFGVERIVLAGLALMALGGALMSVDTVWPAFAGRLVSGAGAVFVNVLMTKMVTDWFAEHDLVPAMALFVASWPLGLALGLISFPPLAAQAGVASVMAAATISVAICFALVALIYRAPPDAPPERGNLRLALSRREWILISLAGSIWGSFNAGYVILVSFLPDLFVLRDYSLIEAGRMVSLLAWIVIASVPIAGYLAQQLQRPNLLMLGSFLLVAAATAALPFAAVPAVPYAVIVLLAGVPAGLTMALPAQALRAENRSTGMGVFYTWHFAAMGGLPALAGSARDVTGSAAAPILVAAATMLLPALALVGFRLMQRRL
jgi:cyanate permease